MPDPQLSLMAMDLRNRAKEILARAETFHDADVQRKLRKIGADYENLADRLERRAGDEP
jgi:tartrate dehydratase alpha subunit/fumarate hydratase class I-like protein